MPLVPWRDGNIRTMTTATALLALVLVAAESGGAPAPEAAPVSTARLEVRAAPECAGRSDLVARVQARSPRIRFVDEPGALAIRAVFTTAHPGTVIGELVLAETGELPTSRRLVTRSCAEAAEAIALIIAVTLDPTSASEGAAASARAAGAGVGAEGTGAGKGQAAPAPASRSAAEEIFGDRAKPRDGAATPTRPESAAASALAAAPAAPPVASRRRVAGVLVGQVIAGPAPGLLPGVAAYLLLGLDREALWSPAVLLGVAHAARSGFVESGGTAAFALDAVALDACGLRWRTTYFEGRACAAALAGQFTARGSETYSPATSARPFVTAGAAASLGFFFSARVGVVARLGAGYTFVRDSFEFAPTVFHRASPLTTTISLGLEILDL
jgi:hypothetical protein